PSKSTGPKSGTAALVRICLARNRVSSYAFRRSPPREAGNRQIKAAPKEMHWTRLPEEAAAKFLEHAVNAHEYAVQFADCLGIIRRVYRIVRETGWDLRFQPASA